MVVVVVVVCLARRYDPLKPELLKVYWKDPEGLPRMCVQRIDQEIDTQRATKNKRNASATLGFMWSKVGSV